MLVWEISIRKYPYLNSKESVINLRHKTYLFFPSHDMSNYIETVQFENNNRRLPQYQFSPVVCLQSSRFFFSSSIIQIIDYHYELKILLWGAELQKIFPIPIEFVPKKAITENITVSLEGLKVKLSLQRDPVQEQYLSWTSCVPLLFAHSRSSLSLLM